MNIRTRLVAEARTWLETPFEFHAQTKGQGVDCCGLVVGCCQAIGLLLPKLPAYEKDFYDLTMYEWGCHNLIKQSPRYKRQPLSGDLLLMRWPIQPIHWGIYTGDNTIVHAIKNGNRMPDKSEKTDAVVETTMTYAMWHRVYAIFTIPSV